MISVTPNEDEIRADTELRRRLQALERPDIHADPRP